MSPSSRSIAVPLKVTGLPATTGAPLDEVVMVTTDAVLPAH
jgi:hypothetical protein